MLKNYFLLIFRNFSRRKLRGWLTILGILIGVAAVVALISVAQGMQDAITEQFEILGANKLMVIPGSGAFGGMYTGDLLTHDDLDTIEKVEVPQVKRINIVKPTRFGNPRNNRFRGNRRPYK